MDETSAKADYLFEVSWEVCNKVGGIYTVVKSKAPSMLGYYKNYFLIGPYFEGKAMLEFVEEKPPAAFASAFSEMLQHGVKCHYGTWSVDSSPKVILIDFNNMTGMKDEIKTKIWGLYKVDSIYSKWDFEEPLLWSWAIGMLIEKINKKTPGKKVCHCHEWLAGGALLYLRSIGSSVGTVFTTHATILGRTIAGGDGFLYENLESMNPEKEAYAHGVQEKFTMERACAHNADVFTTVSEITGIEAEKILGKKPDVILPNGLDLSKFPTIEENSLKHITSREKIREYLTYHFFPYYTFDVKNTLLLFISGRYEIKNKGIDIFIRALGRLNRMLQKNNANENIAVFFWVPRDYRGAKVEVLENKNYYFHIKHYVDWNSKDILQKIVYEFVSNQQLSLKDIFTDHFLLDMKKDLYQFKRQGNPPISPFVIPDEDNDPIVRLLIEEGLDNKQDDKVKVVYYPVYLNSSDGFINLEPYDAMAGCHLGVFPSYYEPWGYTPVEAAVLGVPTVTTDLAGFGRFIEGKLNNENQGVYVLKRFKRDYDSIVKDLTQILENFAKLDKSGRIQKKVSARNLMELIDWKEFIKFYITAHNLAAEKKQ